MNKLIILLNLKGSFKGGAQRRYINLFKELQKSRSDYYLLINKSLYEACIADNIFQSTKNIIVRSVLFEQYQSDNQEKENIELQTIQKKTKSKFRKSIGSNKYFLKLLYSWFLFNITLFRVIKQYKIKSIYAIFTGGIYSWLLAKIMRINFIYTYNDASVSMISRKCRSFLHSEYLPLKKATKVDFLSKKIVESLKKEKVYFNPERILITPNSFIDYSRFNPKYPKKNLITFCSRLTKLKNPDLLLDALSLLKNQGVFKLAFIGDGILLNSLQNRVKDEEMVNVIFYGGMSHPEEILSRSSIFISVQEDNNYPSQSLLEAMACENAIIASDVGETRKLVTEKEGILVNLDANELADAIAYLIKNKEECAIMGKNARKKVLKEHTLENFVNYFLSITSSKD